MELLDALSDAAELGAREAVHRTIVSWRATARINSDPDQLTAAGHYGDALAQWGLHGGGHRPGRWP